MRGGTNWRSTVADPEGFWEFSFLEVTDFDGAWVNVGNLAIGARNVDFLNTYDLEDDIDRNTLTFSASLRGSVGAFSLMPFRSDSPLNVDAASTYQPLLDLHREWKLWKCIRPRGEFPEGPEDYRERARGIVDRIDLSMERDEIRIQGRGPEADLIDHLIIADEVTPKVYAAGTLATVLQAMLDDQFPATYTLVVESSAPSTFIDELTLTEPKKFWQLLSDTAAVGTGVIRFKYADDDTLAIHLFTPNRLAAEGDEDWSLGPDESEQIDNGLALDTVGNYVVIRFVNASGAIETVTSPATPVSASIARYGLKPIVITLAQNSGINDAARAQPMADAIRADRELPILSQVIQGTGLWFGELWDYIGTPANGVLYDEDQAGGVVGYHEHGENSETTNTLTLAGKPKGRYTTWLDISGTVTLPDTTPTVTANSATWKEFLVSSSYVPGVNAVATVNEYAQSVQFELSETLDFAVIISTNSADVVDSTAEYGWVGSGFVTPGKIYYVRATAFSGPLSGGTPTGVAGTFIVANTSNLVQPEDTATVAWDLDEQGKWKASVIGLEEGGPVAGAGLGVYELTFFDYGSAQEPLADIPSAFTEIHEELRRAFLGAGMGTFRVVGYVKELAGGDERIRIGYATAGGSSFTDPGTGADLPLSRLGVVRSDWMAVPVGMASDVDVSPHMLGGDGTRAARLTSLKMQCSPTTRAAGETPPIGGGGGASDFHYDAQALGLADGTAVTTWPDVDNPGVSHDATAGNPSFPGYFDTGQMNGYPGILIESLGGNQRGYDVPYAYAPAEGEMIVVMRARAGGKPWHVGSISFAPNVPTTAGGTMDDHFLSSVIRSFVIGTDPTVPFIYRVRSKAGEWTAWVNGVQVFTTATNTVVSGTPKIGCWMLGGSIADPFDGWFGEVFIRSSHYSPTAAAALEALLASKWGITLP